MSTGGIPEEFRGNGTAVSQNFGNPPASRPRADRIQNFATRSLRDAEGIAKGGIYRRRRRKKLANVCIQRDPRLRAGGGCGGKLS